MDPPHAVFIMTSPTSQVYVFRDVVLNGTTGLELDGGWTTSQIRDGGTTCSSPESSSSSCTYSSLMMEMRLFGECVEGSSFQVSINEAAPYNTSPSSSSYSQIYQSPTLPPPLSANNVKFMNVTSCCFDLVLAAPFPQTDLVGQTLFVDDTYEKIQYTSNWEVNTKEVADIVPVPLMNTSHRTSTVGDTMRFAFSGTNAVVFGGKLGRQIGNFTISYSIDEGSETTRSFNTDGSSYIYQPNFKLVDTGFVPSGDHTLTLTLTSCFNQTLIVDYITYTPNFNTLADMPNVTIAMQAAAPPIPTNSTSSSTTPIGPIVGGTVGGLSLFIIICVFIFWLIRCLRGPRYSYYPIDPYTLKPPFVPSLPRIATKSDSFLPVVSTKQDPAPEAGHDKLARRKNSLVLSSPLVSATRPDPAQAEDISPAELARRLNNLSRQFDRLQSSVIPPAYESQWDDVVYV